MDGLNVNESDRIGGIPSFNFPADLDSETIVASWRQAVSDAKADLGDNSGGAQHPQTAAANTLKPASNSVLGHAWDWTKQEAGAAGQAIGAFDAAHGHMLTRLVGTAQAVSGIAEAGAGAVVAGVGGAATATGAGAAPGIPAMVGGGALAANGLDNAVAGARTAWTGQFHHTLTSQAAGAAALAAGASPKTAHRITDGVDLAQGLAGGGTTIAVGIARKGTADAVKLSTVGRAGQTTEETATAGAKVADTSANVAKIGSKDESAASVADKLSRYLLNPEHPVGGPKAKWFQQALGFGRENSGDLARQLVFDESKAVQTGITQYGTKFNQTIDVAGANGRTIPVTTVWIRGADGVAKLVTAVPSK